MLEPLLQNLGVVDERLLADEDAGHARQPGLQQPHKLVSAELRVHNCLVDSGH